ncbi:hypothetical protein K435DRAFT_868333 [Dendrothele bispora CBS 962.96]|uniref:Uncharacterized protein n=1 Tax=Dendrothele bispora (strain CBS 962.96) TaxID=1314807 RepID=A0A4V4HDC7_DENBC|nr:hypothetical protein K435DRAFT_868333 [Dendrothele bispora CBS 962.96]
MCGFGTLQLDDAPHKCIVEEMLHAIDIAGDFEDSISGKYVLDGNHVAPVQQLDGNGMTEGQ